MIKQADNCRTIIREGNQTNKMPITIVNESVISNTDDELIDKINEMSGDTDNESINNLDGMNKKYVDTLNNEINEIDKIYIYKGLITQLEEKIADLKEQLNFVRDDSSNKSVMINNLLAIVRHITYDIPKERISDSSDSSDGSSKRRTYRKNNLSLTPTEILHELMATPVKSKEYVYYHFPRIDEGHDENGQIDIDQEEERKEEGDNNEEEEEEEEVNEAEEKINIESGSTMSNENYGSTVFNSTEFSVLNDNTNHSNKYHWEKYSNGFASKMLNKMGFKGKGLGKSENGITEPIVIERKNSFNEESDTERPKQSSNLVYILSDSMLNQIDEKRLSKSKDIKVKCHGGCTTKCMYRHLPEVSKLKPKYIILHIGTNDCIEKTSDEVLREIIKLKKYIENASPTSIVIISTPIMRADNSTANQIVQNLNVKLKRMNFKLMDNSNIKSFHLGKKGLHLNDHGTKKMALNIISLIKRL